VAAGQVEDCEGVLNSLWAFALGYKDHSDTLCIVGGLQAAAHKPADVLPEVSRSDGG